jgi:hypothetical protein
VLVRVFLVPARDEGKLDVLDASQQALNDPPADLAGVVLNLLCQALSHILVKVALPCSLIILIFEESIDVLIDNFLIDLSALFLSDRL